MIETSQPKKKSRFWMGTIIFSALIMFFFYLAQPKESEHKKLDYSKPIFTAQGAIVCPQSLLLDPRADHGPDAVFDVFTSFLDRTTKARAIGCEVLNGGIRVYAQRMSTPFDTYVSIGWSQEEVMTLFTMEAELENEDVVSTESPTDLAPAAIQPPEPAVVTAEPAENAPESKPAEMSQPPEQLAAQPTEQEMKQALQKRYEEILLPVEQRHTEAVRMEEERHLLAERSITDKRAASVLEPDEAANQEVLARQEEEKTHGVALWREEQRYSSARASAQAQVVASQPR